MEYKNDRSPDAFITHTSYNKFLSLQLHKFWMEKLHLSWLVPIFYKKNILVFLISNEVTKGLTLKMV